MIEKQNAMKNVISLTEDSELLKKAFSYFDTLEINIKDLRRQHRQGVNLSGTIR